jgi:hypothetical protein
VSGKSVDGKMSQLLWELNGEGKPLKKGDMGRGLSPRIDPDSPLFRVVNEPGEKGEKGQVRQNGEEEWAAEASLTDVARS